MFHVPLPFILMRSHHPYTIQVKPSKISEYFRNYEMLFYRLIFTGQSSYLTTLGRLPRSEVFLSSFSISAPVRITLLSPNVSPCRNYVSYRLEIDYLRGFDEILSWEVKYRRCRGRDFFTLDSDYTTWSHQKSIPTNSECEIRPSSGSPTTL